MLPAVDASGAHRPGDYRPGAYRPGDGHDEMLEPDGTIREHWRLVAEQYGTLGHGELLRRRNEIRRLLEQDGVTYNITGSAHRPSRPWKLDPIPLVLSSHEWRTIEQGALQRAELLDLVLRDLYGERRLLRSGIIPPEMILSDPQFLRSCDGITIPGGKQLVLAATDLARSGDGTWLAIGHRTQAPSGASYALENRRAMMRVFPQLLRDCDVQRVAPYIGALRSALTAAAPSGIEDPAIVVLSPGALSETAFEHASIAAQLGYPLVEGSDFELEDGHVGIRTVGGWTPVDVILRRVDATFSDPLALRSDSTLGIPGLVDACRAGTVSVVNTLGSGVLENAGLGSLMSTLCSVLLDDDLIVESVPAWWCGDPAGRSHVFANLHDLVVRPLSRLALQHSIDTSRLGAAGLDDLRRRIEARPGQWVGQSRVETGTAPVLTNSGFEARPTVLRAFAIADGDGYVAMPGGLARTAVDTGGKPISNRTGAYSKDTWVLRSGAEFDDERWPTEPIRVRDDAVDTLPARAAEHLFWLGRYAERAEATVRLVRAVNNRRDEFDDRPAGPGPAALVVLLEAVTRVTGTFPGFVGDDARNLLDDPSDELVSLVVDDERAGTIAHAVRHMFDAIDVLRDQLSVDTWLVIGSLQRELERLEDHARALETEPADGDPAGVGDAGDAGDAGDQDEVMAAVLDSLLQGLLSLAGIANESMVRDQGWQFMEAGRRIERAMQVTMLVGSSLASDRSAPVESVVLESMLTAGESVITARRRYRSQVRAVTAIELMYGDAGNPRSLRFQIDRLGQSLVALDAHHHPMNEHRPSETATLFAHIVELLDGADWPTLAQTSDTGQRLDLTHFVFEVRGALFRLADAIAAQSFTRLHPQLALATTPSSATGSPGMSR